MAPGTTPGPSNTASTTAKPNGRKGSKKVRTGCTTCKIRKVKCDETKPACKRCTKAGRLCYGYLTTNRGKALSNVDATSDELFFVSELGSLPEFGSTEEQRTFHFFRQFTGPRLAADLDSGFWTRLVLKLCHSEPAVRHGVLAVSSFHESLVQGEQGDYEELADKQVFALQQYNKAISILRNQISDAALNEPLVPLLMCLLFVCMEYMQGKEIESLNYLLQGRQMMHQFIQTQQIPSSQLDLIRQHIVPIYVRSCLTSFLYGANVLPVPDALNVFSEIPPKFSSMEEARHTFYSIADRVLRSAFVARQTKYNISTPPEIAHALNVEQQALLSILTKWNAAFTLFTVTRPDGAPRQPSALLLHLYFHAAVIWVSTSLTQQETDFDKHVDTFSAMLRIAREFLEATDSKARKARPTNRSSANTSQEKARVPTSGCNVDDIPDTMSKLAFAFETHVIPPLYFISVKCRHPLIRRAALDLLKKHDDRQENLWRARCMARVAARFIEIETNISIKAKQGTTTTSASRRGISLEDRSLPIFSQDDFFSNIQDISQDFPSSLFQTSHERTVPVSVPGNSYPDVGKGRRVPPTSTRRSRGNLSGYGVFSTHDHPVEYLDISFDWDPSVQDFDMSNVPLETYEASSSNQQGAAEPSPPVEPELSPSTLNELLTFASSGVEPGFDSLQSPRLPIDMTLRSGRDHTLPTRPRSSRSGSEIPTGVEGGDISELGSLEPPYNLPEDLRISDAVIGPLESDGRWVTFFRKPRTIGGKWEKWDEYIFTS